MKKLFKFQKAHKEGLTLKESAIQTGYVTDNLKHGLNQKIW